METSHIGVVEDDRFLWHKNVAKPKPHIHRFFEVYLFETLLLVLYLIQQNPAIG